MHFGVQPKVWAGWWSLIANAVNCTEVVHEPFIKSRKGQSVVWKASSTFWELKPVCRSVTPSSCWQLLLFLHQNLQQKLSEDEIFSTVIPVMHCIATWLAHTWLSCSIRVSQETSCGKGLPVWGKDTVHPHSVLALLRAFGDGHTHLSIFTQAAEDPAVVKLQSGSLATGL